MHIFYSENHSGRQFVLDNSESNHLARVLRLKNGDSVEVVNGDGNLYHCVVLENDPRNSKVEIVETVENFDARGYRLHIAIAPTKSIDRFEFFVEKSVEIGVDEITPIISSRSERKQLKTERIERVILSAMKQSLKAKRTIINPVTPLTEFLKINKPGKMFIAHCIDSLPQHPLEEVYDKGDEATVLIGPEGDFTEDEVKSAINKGASPLSLGSSRLRTETAGIVACSHVYFLNQL